MQWIRFLHILAVVTLTGCVVASYFYNATLFKTKVHHYVHFVLQKLLWADLLIILPLFLVSLITGMISIVMQHLLISPWIISVYVFFALALCCWLICFFLRLINFKAFNIRQNLNFKGKKCFHAVNILVLLFFLLIVHDSVMRTSIFTTWFSEAGEL